MRAKVDKAKKHTTRTMSLPPKLSKLASHRAVDLDRSFSDYMQALIQLDLEKDLIQPKLP